MLLAELESTSRELASTASRSAKRDRIAAVLRRLDPGEIEAAVALLSGDLRQGRLGIGPAAVRAAADVPHADRPALTVADVDDAFARLATLAGPGSGTARASGLSDLLRRATGPESEWLIRVVLGGVRQGALEGLMQEAVAKAAGVPATDVRRAAMFAGDLPAVTRAALLDGAAGLRRFGLTLFRPVLPMLAQPADDLAEAIGRLGTAAVEYKLDGARVQVHRSGEEVRVYSRQGNDVTVAVPELVEVVRALPARELILDGEVIALRGDGAPHPFQVTMRRFGRRLEVEAMRRELPLTPFFFDVLRLDGEDLIDAAAARRAAALAGVAAGLVVPRIVTARPEEAERFFAESLAHGHEGVVAKSVDAPYAAGSRGLGWIKVKPAHTLDLVVLAVERGSGRRDGWLSNIHLGARDAAGGFVMIGKTFKGMTDAMLAWQTERFRELAVADDGYVVHLRPEQVVEIAFNDVQASPHYPGGVALRFARVKRYRDDKSAADADTIESVRAILHGPVTRRARRGP